MVPGPAEHAGACPVAHWQFTGPRRPALEYFVAMDSLQEQHRPFFRSDEEPGYYVFTDQKWIFEVLQDPELFSSAAVMPTDPDPPHRLIPEQLDPPEHTKWRQLLAGYFAPRRIETMAEAQRSYCVELIERLSGAGGCDFVSDFARLFPTSIFLRLLGLPMADFEKFMEWEHKALHLSEDEDPGRQIGAGAMLEFVMYLTEFVAERRAATGPAGDDIISAAVHWEIDGRGITDDELLNCLVLLFVAGLDTVANQLSYSLHHLATHAADRKRLVAEPTLTPIAVEELLRAYPIVQPSRKATRDIDFHGCPIHAGDMIMLPLAAAGRDDAAYRDAKAVDFDRESSRHLSFGAGPHRCLGSHLARQELKIVLEEWHRRIPDYGLAGSAIVTEHSGGIFGLDTLPLRW